MLEKHPANCVHTNITRESVMISSTQVLSAEKCSRMNAGIVSVLRNYRCRFDTLEL